MGYFSSSQSTTTTLAPLSAEGQSMDSLLMQMMQENLKQYGGYNVDTVQKTKYNDPSKAAGLQSQIASIDAQISQISSSATSSSPNGPRNLPAGGLAVQSKLDSLNKQKNNLQNQLTNLPSTTYQDYKLTKQEDPQVQAAIDKYGADAPEVQQARETVKSDNLDALQMKANINQDFLKNMQKLAKGDMSYTPEQASQVNTYIAPVKDLIISTTKNLLDQYGQDDAALHGALNDLSTQIDKTGFAVEDALHAASVQYDKSGATLMDTLKTVNSSSEAKAKFQFDLMSQQADMKAAQQAAMLGLPPGSQAEKAAAMKMKTDALTSIQLNLAQQEAQGALSIQGSVEQGKQNISLSQVALAQSQGEKKEGVASKGLELTQMLAGKKEAAVGNQGNAMINLEQQKQGMLENLAYGGLPANMQATTAGLAFNQNQAANGLSIQNSLMSPVAQQLGVAQNQQVAGATTTTTKTPSFMDVFTGLAGAAASTAGAVYGMGGFGTGAPSPGGTPGGSPLASPMPTLNLSTYAPTPNYNLGNVSSGLSL